MGTPPFFQLSTRGIDVVSSVRHSEKKKKRVSFFLFIMSYSGGGGGGGLADKLKSTNWRALGRNITNKVKQYAMNLSPLEVQVEEGACVTVETALVFWFSGFLLDHVRTTRISLTLSRTTTRRHDDTNNQRPTWIRGVRTGR